jgi:UDP-N-acetyl-D-mannosaminuronic acid dehydrogenase
MNNILVVGLGYIGLPLALRLAELDHTVYGEDISADRRKCVTERVSPWPMEPEIGDKLQSTTLKIWTGDLYDTIIFAVNVDTVDCKQLLDAMKYYDLYEKLVIVESTLPPLGTDKVKAALPESARFAYCPERLTAGKLWWNLTHEARVIGGDPLALEIYRDVTFGDVVLTDLRTAELVKLAENAYRYEKIDFANRLALRCQELPGADVWKVIDILNERLGSDVPLPGAGIGGYCLQKDRQFLSVPSSLFEDIDYTSEEIREYARLLAEFIRPYGYGTCVFLGGAYKANVSDRRNSPADILAEELYKLCQASSFILDAGIRPSADTIVIVQPHDIYKAIDWRGLEAKTVIDLCGFFQRQMHLPDESERGWDYVCLGMNG